MLGRTGHFHGVCPLLAKLVQLNPEPAEKVLRSEKRRSESHFKAFLWRGWITTKGKRLPVSGSLRERLKMPEIGTSEGPDSAFRD